MTQKPGVHNVVALLVNRPADKLERGDVGTIVETDGDAALVEFNDKDGRCRALITCKLSDILPLKTEQAE